MVGDWFFDADFCEPHKGKKGHFRRFSLTLKTVIFVLVQTQKAIFGNNRDVPCVYWISKFKRHFILCSQLTVKAIFVRLRKLQCFEAWESCAPVLAGMGVNGLKFSHITVIDNILIYIIYKGRNSYTAQEEGSVKASPPPTF